MMTMTFNDDSNADNHKTLSELADRWVNSHPPGQYLMAEMDGEWRTNSSLAGS